MIVVEDELYAFYSLFAFTVELDDEDEDENGKILLDIQQNL